MRDLAGEWRHPGWSWTVRHERLVPAGSAVGTVLAGGALGIVPSLVTDDWKSGLTWALLWVCIGLAVVAAAAFGFSELTRRGRDRMLRQNGTAYIIYEHARGWTAQDVTRFWQGIRQQFARVVQVPGPREMARGWDWPLDAAARHWDGKVDELVRAFQVLHRDESHNGMATPNSVFIWAWWAVAAAFGMRATAADRGLELNVWQRPSKAREAAVYPEIWAQRPHRFASATAAPDLAHELTEHLWKAGLTVTRRGRPRHGASDAGISVLLVRFSTSKWGPLPEVAVPLPENHQLELELHDAAGAVPASAPQIEVHELRCIPPVQGFGWEAYPGLAAAAVAWIERKTRELAGSTLLLGTAMPQEIGLGLGILAGQPTRRSLWPVHLWPIVAEPANYDLVVPHLDLGAASVAPELANGKGA